MTKPNKKWNVWRIKSPWVRLPIVWLLMVFYTPAIVSMGIAIAIVGAVKGAYDESTYAVQSYNKHIPWREMWRACTIWRT